MNRHARRALAAATTATLGLGAALAVAAPASADSFDIVTPAFYWEAVSDDALNIDDAWAQYTDLFGSGVNVQGWTSDAFDGFLYDFGLTHDGETLYPAFVPVSSDLNDLGLSRLVSSATATFADETSITVQATLDIQGNYARWSFAFTGDTTADAEFVGNLGSDGSSIYVPVGASSLVSHDEDGYDPIIGYQLTGSDTAFDTSSIGDTGFTASTAAPVSLVIALLDYDPCTRDAAIAEMTSLAPSLSATFGQVLYAPASECVTITSPAGFVEKTSTEQTLTLAFADDEVGAEIQEYLESEDVTYLVDGLPAGLTATFDPEALTVTLSGTAAPGSYELRLVFFAADEDGGFSPLFLGPLGFTVSAAAAPQLADSGLSDVSPALAVIGGLLVIAGAGALIVRRVRSTH